MWEQIRANKLRAAVLAGVIAVILVFFGWGLGMYFVGDPQIGLAVALIVWLCMLLVSYFAGDSLFLTMSRARRIKPDAHPILYNIVEEMKIAAGLPRMPEIYIIDDPALNAFATGRSPEKAAIVVTSGLLESLDRDQLQGVVAHEMAHIQNRDVFYMLVVGVMVGTIAILADITRRYLFFGGRGRRRTSGSGGGQVQVIIMLIGLALMLLAPFLAQLVYFACSRRKEYLADACASAYTRFPEGLAGALEKIASKPILMAAAIKPLAPMYIVNPLKAQAMGLADITSTHPPISERVRILRSMAGGAAFKDYDQAFRKVTRRPVGVIPFSALKTDQPISARQSQSQPETPLERIRLATDALWHLNQFIFIACTCGTKLKFPPVFLGKLISCPHCPAEHFVTNQTPF
jgi:heat shock protein HtpX